MRELKFYYDKNGTATDYSKEMSDLLRDPIMLDYVAADDALVIGLYKPFRQIYIEMQQANSGFDLTATYWDGSTFKSLDLDDDTRSLSRSGFIHWEKPSDWSPMLYEGEQLYLIKIDLQSDGPLNLDGCNIVFADDHDLEKVVRKIDRYKASGDSSFIAYHVAARDEIIQMIRNSGNAIRDNKGNRFNFSKWDILDIDEIRQAAKYLALALIFFDASDNVGDKDYQRSKDFRADFGEAFKLFFRSFDFDDDGEIDNHERLAMRTIRSIKV